MSKATCVEINGVFYESYNQAGRIIGCSYTTVKKRCLSDEWLNYKIMPFRITYTEKKCRVCGKVKLLKEFPINRECRDGLSIKCKECHKVYAAEYRKNNPEHIKEYKKRPEVKTRNNKRKRERRKTDIAYKVNEAMSSAINKSLKGMKNGAHLEDLVDWTIEELIIHLESLFTEGMSWDNYGFGDDKWHVDHKKAKSKFKITSYDCQAFRDCWSLPNLQPMWQLRNMEKGDKPMHPKYLIKPDNIK